MRGSESAIVGRVGFGVERGETLFSIKEEHLSRN